jgi:Protein of unknown function (DUF4238)
MADLPDQKSTAQHYVPKFYLKGFTGKNGILWVYERFKPKRPSKPKQEAHRTDFYTHFERGFRDESAEAALREIESRASTIICKLANPQYELSKEGFAHLIIFISFMFVRVPSWRDYLNKAFAAATMQSQIERAKDKTKFYQTCAEMQQSTGKLLGMEPEDLRQFILTGEYEIEQTSEAFSLGEMFTSGLAVMDELRYFGYEVLYAPTDKFFVTSDCPVYTLQPDGKGQATIGMGFGWPDVEVFFPLNKRACLRLKRRLLPTSVFIRERRLQMVNDLIMATATQFLYSNENSKRLSRLFDERGCKIRAGRDAFLVKPPDTHRVLFD